MKQDYAQLRAALTGEVVWGRVGPKPPLIKAVVEKIQQVGTVRLCHQRHCLRTTKDTQIGSEFGRILTGQQTMKADTCPDIEVRAAEDLGWQVMVPRHQEIDIRKTRAVVFPA